MSIENRKVSLTVETLDSLYLIPVNYKDITVPLLFDTGASISVVTRTTAIKFEAKETERTIRGGGNAGKINETGIVVIPEISLGDITVYNLEAAVIEDEALNFDFGEEKGSVQINGFLGWDIIERYRWTYDCTKRLLTIGSLKDNESKKNMVEWDNMPIISVLFDGNKELFGIDTGNTESVLGERLYNFLEGSREAEDTFVGVDGASVEKVRIMDKLVLQIADCTVTLRNIPACNRSVFPTENKNICGLLGADVLAGKNWLIDYHNQTIEIW